MFKNKELRTLENLQELKDKYNNYSLEELKMLLISLESNIEYKSKVNNTLLISFILTLVIPIISGLGNMVTKVIFRSNQLQNNPESTKIIVGTILILLIIFIISFSLMLGIVMSLNKVRSLRKEEKVVKYLIDIK